MTIEQAMAQSSYLKDSHVAPNVARDATKDKVRHICRALSAAPLLSPHHLLRCCSK